MFIKLVWVYSSVEEPMPNMYVALGFITSSTKGKEGTGGELNKKSLTNFSNVPLEIKCCRKT